MLKKGNVGQDRLTGLGQGKFARGKGLFHAVEHQEAAELPDEEYPLLLTTGRNMFH